VHSSCEAFGTVLSEFAANNALLNLTLGALSLGEQLLSLVEQYAPGRGPDQAELPLDEDPAMFALLGAICLAEHIRGRAAEVAAVKSGEPARPGPRFEPLASLLR